MQFRKSAIFVLFLAMMLAFSGCGKKSEPQAGNGRVNEQKGNAASTTPISENQQVATNSPRIEAEDNIFSNVKIHYIDASATSTKEVSDKTEYKVLEPEKKVCIDKLDLSCWNLFINEKYGYQIKYPVDRRVSFHSPFGEEKGQMMCIISNDNNDPYYAPVVISVYNSNGQSFEEWYDVKFKNLSNAIDRIKKAKNIMHNDIRYVFFDDKIGPEYYAINDNKFVNFSLMEDFINEEQGRKMLETIVFSFEFTH